MADPVLDVMHGAVPAARRATEIFVARAGDSVEQAKQQGRK
jgi:hypothetical protein